MAVSYTHLDVYKRQQHKYLTSMIFNYVVCKFFHNSSLMDKNPTQVSLYRCMWKIFYCGPAVNCQTLYCFIVDKVLVASTVFNFCATTIFKYFRSPSAQIPRQNLWSHQKLHSL